MKSPRQIVFLLFITLVALTGSAVHGQQAGDAAARLVDSFGPVPNGDMRGRMDLFLAELAHNSDSKGMIYVHGTPAETAGRTRYFQNQINFRSFDALRIKFLKGRNVGEVRSDFWLVPPGAHEPDVKPEAWIFKDIRQAIRSAVTTAMSGLDKEAQKLRDHQSYIINYGTPSQIRQRERWIRDAISFRRYDASRITLVNGGPGPVRTVMWLVPPGAENPRP
jgi:hypothetical protein